MLDSGVPLRKRCGAVVVGGKSHKTNSSGFWSVIVIACNVIAVTFFFCRRLTFWCAREINTAGGCVLPMREVATSRGVGQTVYPRGELLLLLRLPFVCILKVPTNERYFR